MKQLFTILTVLVLTLHVSAQQKKYIGAALFNTQPDMPFGKFTGMFSDALHPGIEFMYGKNFSSHKKHDWFYEYQLAYFFHRYVQHGIPLYANFGYRYHFSKSFAAETSFGAGFMESVPDAQIFTLSSDGSYEKKKNKDFILNKKTGEIIKT